MTYRDWHSAFGSQLDHANAGPSPAHAAAVEATPTPAESFLGGVGFNTEEPPLAHIGEHSWGGFEGPPPSLNDVAFGPVHIVPVHDTYTEGHHFNFGDF